MSVSLPARVVAVAAGPRHTCFLLPNVTSNVYCVGFNDFGQLGDGSNTQRLGPVAVVGLASVTVVTLALGSDHTCMLTSSGGVKCTGYNAFGQIGVGSFVDCASPVDVTGLSVGVTNIAAGAQHTCAIQHGGLWCWGLNSEAQLGDGSLLSKPSPTIVSALSSGVTQVACGTYHTCAVTITASVYCFGSNSHGQVTCIPNSNAVLSLLLKPVVVVVGGRWDHHFQTHPSCHRPSVCCNAVRARIYDMCPQYHWRCALLGPEF